MSTPLEREWSPFDPCPCGCPVVSAKLNVRSGHVRSCACHSCVGRRNRKSGKKHQATALKDASRAEGVSMPIAPSQEEAARLLMHYEVKSGEQVRGALNMRLRDWIKQSRLFAQRQVPLRKWAVVLRLPRSVPGLPRRIIVADYDEFLALVEELGSGP